MKRSVNTSYFIEKSIFNIILLLLFIICILNNRDPDFANYEKQYIAYGTGNIASLLYKYETLYSSIGLLFYHLGLSFYQYRIFIFSIAFIILRKVFIDYAEKPIFVLICFMVFPFLLFCVQMRSSIGIVIVMYGIRFLKYNTRNGNIKYIATVIIAAMFHEMCLFYLTLLLVNQKNFYKLYKWFLFAEFVFAYTLFPATLRVLFSLTHNRRFWYYNFNVPISVVIRHSLPAVVLIIILLYCRGKTGLYDDNCHTTDEIFIRCSLIICSAILFIKVNINFSRLLYFMIPFIMITISNVSTRTEKRKIKNDRYLLRGISFTVSLIYFISLLSPLQEEYYESVTRSVLPWLG